MEKVQETGIMKKLMMLALAVVLIMPALIAPSASAVGSTGPRFIYEGEGTEDDPGEEDCDDALWIDCGDAAGGAEAPTPAEKPPQEPELWPEIVEVNYTDRWHGAEVGAEPVVGDSPDAGLRADGGGGSSSQPTLDIEDFDPYDPCKYIEEVRKEIQDYANKMAQLAIELDNMRRNNLFLCDPSLYTSQQCKGFKDVVKKKEQDLYSTARNFQHSQQRLAELLETSPQCK